MPKIYVKKAFTLHHKDEKHEFPDGSVMGWHTLESAKEWIITVSLVCY